MPAVPLNQAPKLQEGTKTRTNIDIEAQHTARDEANPGQRERRPSQTGSQAASQSAPSNSTKSLGRWEEYRPGNFKASCVHKLDPSKCTECGSKTRQKRLFWVGSLLCTAVLIAMFVVVAIVETDYDGGDEK